MIYIRHSPPKGSSSVKEPLHSHSEQHTIKTTETPWFKLFTVKSIKDIIFLLHISGGDKEIHCTWFHLELIYFLTS